VLIVGFGNTGAELAIDLVWIFSLIIWGVVFIFFSDLYFFTYGTWSEWEHNATVRFEVLFLSHFILSKIFDIWTFEMIWMFCSVVIRSPINIVIRDEMAKNAWLLPIVHYIPTWVFFHLCMNSNQSKDWMNVCAMGCDVIEFDDLSVACFDCKISSSKETTRWPLKIQWYFSQNTTSISYHKIIFWYGHCCC
jgi:hypothetical protein